MEIDRDILAKKVLWTYKEFRIHFTGRTSYRTVIDNRVLSMINNFAILLEKEYGDSVADNFLVDYFYFQFEFWHDRETKYGNIPLLNWCIGKKGFKRWKNKSANWKHYARKKLGQIPPSLRHSLNQGSVYAKTSKKQVDKDFVSGYKLNHIKNLSQIEEQDKVRAKDLEEPLVYCMVFTTMYHPKSKICRRCKEVKNCKKMQKDMYPELHKIRING